jgi:hypothetical protein
MPASMRQNLRIASYHRRHSAKKVVMGKPARVATGVVDASSEFPLGDTFRFYSVTGG